jgi:hypothetical protein
VLLLVCTLLVLVAAYALRPTVHVDVGNYYDSAFLHHFHDREVDSAGPGTSLTWPPEQQALELPGHRRGEWIATIYAASNQPDDVLRGLAVSANHQRLNIPRHGERSIIAVIPPEIAAAEQIVLRLEPGLREGPQQPPGLAGRVVLEPARTYRWSRAESTLTFPGLGRGAWRLDMDVVAAHPGDHPVQAQIVAHGTPIVTLPDRHELRRISVLVPAHLMQGGDLDVTIRSNPYEDPRPLGLLLSDVNVLPIETGTAPLLPLSLSSIPPWSSMLTVMVIILVVYGCLAHLGVAPWSALAWSTLAVLAAGWALSLHRFPTTFMLPGLTLLALWSMVLLLVLRPLLMRVLSRPSSPQPPDNGSIERFVNILLLIFFVGYWVKAGAMLYPYFVGIDVHWHMDRVRWIINGDLPLLYGVDSPLNESTMPLAEWGPQKPVIPYSPYYHMLAATFVIFPWSLEMSANMVSVLFDCSRVLLIALLAYRGGLGKRAAVLAALLYAVLPVTFLLHSWGNVPTTSGLWWAFAATVFLVVQWERLHRPAMFAALALLLVASFLIYTVAGAFMGLFLLLFSGLVLLLPRHPTPLAPRLGVLWVATALAIVLVMVVYYGQYIGPIVERTIPYFAESLTSTAEEMGKASADPVEYVVRHTRLWDYGLMIPFWLTLAWIAAEGYTIWRAGQHPCDSEPSSSDPTPCPHASPLLWAAISGWMGVTLVFLLLAYKVSMVDKHFFVSIPFMVIATAALIDRFWQRARVLRVVAIVWYVYLGMSALHLWVARIISVKQG